MKTKESQTRKTRHSYRIRSSSPDVREFARAFDLPAELAEHFFDPETNLVGLGVEAYPEQRLNRKKGC